MTNWTILQPHSRGQRGMTEPTISAHDSGGAIRVSVRLPPALCAQLLWQRGTPLEIAASHEAGVWRLRLRLCTAGRGYRLQAVSKSKALAVGYTPSPHRLAQKRPAQTVRHVITQEGLILTVPAWAAMGDPPAKDKAA